MKRIIPFSKYFIPAAILSFILMGSGAVGFFQMGFNLGIDFQPGLNQEVQFAPTAFRLTYNGPGNAVISFSRSSIDIMISGITVEEVTYNFPFAVHTTQADLIRALRAVQGLHIAETAPGNIESAWLIQSAQSSPRLEAVHPFTIH